MIIAANAGMLAARGARLTTALAYYGVPSSQLLKLFIAQRNLTFIHNNARRKYHSPSLPTKRKFTMATDEQPNIKLFWSAPP